MRSKEVKLPSGVEVRYREVPTYALNVVYEKYPPIPAPKVTLQSAVGGEETHDVLQGTPEWDDYMKNRRDRTIQIAHEVLDFSIAYGVLAWRFPDESEEWETEAPEDWTVPSVMLRYGATAPKDEYEKRLAYIKHEVVVTEDDASALDKVLAGKQPVTNKEVKAAMTPFVSPEEESP